MDLLTITRNFLTCLRTRPALKNPDKYALRKVSAIVCHWTSNTGKGANAAAHRSYFNQGLRAASAHYVVDDHSIVQCLPDREVGFHCGDTPLGRGKYKPVGVALMAGAKGVTPNYYTVGVEMCVNSDGDWNKTRKNSAALFAYLLAKHGLQIDQLIRHFDVTGKACPGNLLTTPLWEGFRAEVAAILQTYTGAIRATVASKGLNVRTGPGANFPIVTELKMGEPVILFETSGDWWRVETGGWVNGKFLTPAPSYMASAISLPA